MWTIIFMGMFMVLNFQYDPLYCLPFWVNYTLSMQRGLETPLAETHTSDLQSGVFEHRWELLSRATFSLCRLGV